MHKHFPRYVLRVLSWVGLVWLPEDVLTTLARRGTGVTVIASPEDERDIQLPEAVGQPWTGCEGRRSRPA